MYNALATAKCGLPLSCSDTKSTRKLTNLDAIWYYRYTLNTFFFSNILNAGTSGRAVKGVVLRPLACCDGGFVSRWVMEVCLLWLLCVFRL
jgi:hypothetical protein